MRNLLKRKKIRLLILAIAISFFPWVLPISWGNMEHVYSLGFPDIFVTMHGHISEFPAGLGINLIQFLGNVGVNWLILCILVKAFGKLTARLRHKKDSMG
ncbi:hypothetical protein [Lacrimispora sp. 38-1]|uniref:hypothetical protein n=1 Tax=Lacrimispora sp. 38-1 TaxID=3125778 RepID=UPI003CF69B66